MEVEKTEIRVVLGADHLKEWLFSPLIAYTSRPGLIEAVGIVHRNGVFQPLASIDRVPALHDMQFLGVRRAIDIETGLGVQANRIDHQRVAFIMADRFSVPGW